MDRFALWMTLVQTASLSYETVRAQKGADAVLAVHVLAEAARVPPKSLPHDLEAATWAFVDMHYQNGPRPEWLK